MGEAKKSVTLVFPADARDFRDNPFKIETPYGCPYAVSIGDALEREMILRDALETLSTEWEGRSEAALRRYVDATLAKVDRMMIEDMKPANAPLSSKGGRE